MVVIKSTSYSEKENSLSEPYQKVVDHIIYNVRLKKAIFMEKVLFLIAFIILGCASQEMLRVRQMEIQNVDINNIRDGEYLQAFSYSGATTTSRALMKAVENSLNTGISK